MSVKLGEQGEALFSVRTQRALVQIGAVRLRSTRWKMVMQGERPDIVFQEGCNRSSWSAPPKFLDRPSRFKEGRRNSFKIVSVTCFGFGSRGRGGTALQPPKLLSKFVPYVAT